MRNALALAVVLTAAIGAAPRATAQEGATPCDPAPVLGELRRSLAPGGWNVITTESAGDVRASGLSGTFSETIDRTGGRSHVVIATPPIREERVFDGTHTWVKDRYGGVHPHDAPEARAAALTGAYLDRRAYLLPRAAGATIVCTSVRDKDGAADVLHVTPQGALPVDLRIDPRTHLITVATIRRSWYTHTIRMDDYRLVSGIRFPLHVIEEDADPSDRTEMRYRALRVLRSEAPNSAYARLAPDGNARFLTGARSTRVALTIEGGQPVVMARINGRGPFPFIFDTGGRAILTAQAAEAIGLPLSGAGTVGGAGEGRQPTRYAGVEQISIGDAVLDHVPVTVVPFPYAFRERGRDPEKAGILGIEFLERFTVRFDYPAGYVELSSPDVTPSSNGRSVPIAFEEDVPLAPASVDGVDGAFMIDTGNSGSLVLFGPFLRDHPSFANYGPGLPDIAWGAGGTYSQVRHRVHSFAFGGAELHDVVTNFVTLERGSLASWTLAGNIGYDVLAQFADTFDYERGRMLVEAPATPVPRRPFDRSGLRIEKDAPDAVAVAGVYPGSPAAVAGIERGDRILAVNGVPASDLSGSRVFDTLHGPVGSRVRLTVARGERTRAVTLVLHDLAF